MSNTIQDYATQHLNRVGQQLVLKLLAGADVFEIVCEALSDADGWAEKITEQMGEDFDTVSSVLYEIECGFCDQVNAYMQARGNDSSINQRVILLADQIARKAAAEAVQAYEAQLKQPKETTDGDAGDLVQ